jgi:hypothetical protein
MSQLEIAKNSPTTFCFVFDPMVAGSILNAAAIPNFSGTTSKIVGCERVVVGGTVGQPYAVVASAGASLFPEILLRSSNIADESTYAIYWTNQVAYSPNQVILPC